MMKYAYVSPTINEIKHVGKIGWEWHDALKRLTKNE